MRFASGGGTIRCFQEAILSISRDAPGAFAPRWHCDQNRKGAKAEPYINQLIQINHLLEVRRRGGSGQSELSDKNRTRSDAAPTDMDAYGSSGVVI